MGKETVFFRVTIKMCMFSQIFSNWVFNEETLIEEHGWFLHTGEGQVYPRLHSE